MERVLESAPKFASRVVAVVRGHAHFARDRVTCRMLAHTTPSMTITTTMITMTLNIEDTTITIIMTTTHMATMLPAAIVTVQDQLGRQY